MLGKYKSYVSAVEFDAADNIFFGHLDDISDIVGFPAEKVDDTEKTFHEAVDDYIEARRKIGREPIPPSA